MVMGWHRGEIESRVWEKTQPVQLQTRTPTHSQKHIPGWLNLAVLASSAPVSAAATVKKNENKKKARSVSHAGQVQQVITVACGYTQPCQGSVT